MESEKLEQELQRQLEEEKCLKIKVQIAVAKARNEELQRDLENASRRVADVRTPSAGTGHCTTVETADLSELTVNGPSVVKATYSPNSRDVSIETQNGQSINDNLDNVAAMVVDGYFKDHNKGAVALGSKFVIKKAATE